MIELEGTSFIFINMCKQSMKAKVIFPYFKDECKVLLDYAFKKCDKFYIVFPLAFPYNKHNPKYVDSELHDILLPYQKEHYLSCENPYSITVPAKSVMTVYECGKKTRQILNDYIKYCVNNNEKTVDNIGFIYSDFVWMNCIAHEKENFIYIFSKEDEKQLEGLKIFKI